MAKHALCRELPRIVDSFPALHAWPLHAWPLASSRSSFGAQPTPRLSHVLLFNKSFETTRS